MPAPPQLHCQLQLRLRGSSVSPGRVCVWCEWSLLNKFKRPRDRNLPVLPHQRATLSVTMRLYQEAEVKKGRKWSHTVLNVTGSSGMCPFHPACSFLNKKSSAFTLSASCSPSPSSEWIDPAPLKCRRLSAVGSALLSPHPPTLPQQGRLRTFPPVFSETSVQ